VCVSGHALLTHDYPLHLAVTRIVGERVGLVGQNGAGKSTLLGAIAGVRRAEEGRMTIKSGARVGYLVQTAVSGSDNTVWQEVHSAHQSCRMHSKRAV
jgi:ATPase subunit of ABC transporter with duplicated ATPase domains